MRTAEKLSDKEGLISPDCRTTQLIIIIKTYDKSLASLVVLVVKYHPTNAGNIRNVDSIPWLGRPPGEGMTTHSSILAWRISWTEEPDGLQSMGSQRVRHDCGDLAHTHAKSYHRFS